MSFHRFAFRAGCNTSRQVAAGEPWHAQFDAREQRSETARHMVERGWGHLREGSEHSGDKLAVAPLRVDDLYFHFLIKAREPYSANPHTVPTLLAYIKHVRRHAGADKCEDLRFEDPPARVSILEAL